MIDQPTLFGDQAVARRTDPLTSWEAANGISVDSIKAGQGIILKTLIQYGPMTDDQLYSFSLIHGTMSPSGARTRRSELVNKGLVKWTGNTRPSNTGRASRIWTAV